MKSLVTLCVLFTIIFFVSAVSCDDDIATDPVDGIVEDGTCDKDSCGSDEQRKAPPKPEETLPDIAVVESEDDKEEEIIVEEDIIAEKETIAEEEEEKKDILPVTSCICTGIEEQPEVGVEVLFKPESCGRRTPVNNDDVVTLLLRGYKASDMSEFMTTYNEDGSEGLSIFFPIGVGSSIKGLELGLLGMCVGEKRKLTIPSKLVRNGRKLFEGDNIPRGETLIFEVELIGAYPHYQSGMPNMFERMNTNKNDLVEWQEVHDYMVLEGAFPDGPESVIPRLTTEWIEKADKDKDGKLTWEEFPLPKFSSV